MPDVKPVHPQAATVSLKESYRYCEKLTRQRAGNFYFAFLTLRPERRRAMCAVYAFMRYCDDLADDAGVIDRRQKLESWRQTLRRAAAGETSAHPMLPAFADVISRFQIPLEYFDAVIDGAEMDLTPSRYASFDDLYRYCYRVASVVGLTCIHVFGFENRSALELGEWCGIAFQLTNIIRDVGEDAAEDRVYLPQDEMARYECTQIDLEAPSISDRLKRLLAFQGARAEEYYRRAIPLLDMVSPQSRGCLSALICIYHGLLRRIQREGYEVLAGRVSLPLRQKLGIAFRCWVSPARALQREFRIP